MALSLAQPKSPIGKPKESPTLRMLARIQQSGRYMRRHANCTEVEQSAYSVQSNAQKIEDQYGALIEAIETGRRGDAIEALMAVLNEQNKIVGAA